MDATASYLHSTEAQSTLLIVAKKCAQDSQWILYLALTLAFVALAIGLWGIVTQGPWHLPAFSTSTFKDAAAGIQSVVTALGVVIGGSWAYFKFVRGRSHKPRFAVELAGQWRDVNGANLLHVRLRITNMSAVKVHVNQHGTGLKLSFPSDASHNEIQWNYVQLKRDNEPDVDRTFEVLLEHAWIEPGETVSDDLLLDLDGEPRLFKLEFSLEGSTSSDHAGEFSSKDVEVCTRRIVAPEESLIDKMTGSKSI